MRALLAVSCQKIFFEEGHDFYHYGPLEVESGGGGYRTSWSSGRGRSMEEMDLQMASPRGEVQPYVSRKKSGSCNNVVVTERVYEYHYLRHLLSEMFARVGGTRIKTDNAVINLSLLSLLLDFGLYEQHASVLNLPFMLPQGPSSSPEVP